MRQVRWCSAKSLWHALAADHRVHPAKTLTEYAHDIQRKAGRLLGEKKKALLVDRCQGAIRQRGDGCSARRVIDQRHFADQASRRKLFKDFVAIADAKLARQYDVHGAARIVFFEKDLSSLEGHDILFIL